MNDYGYNCLRRENVGWTRAFLAGRYKTGAALGTGRERGEDEVEVQVTDVDSDRYIYGIRPDELTAFMEWVEETFGSYWVRDEYDYMIAD